MLSLLFISTNGFSFPESITSSVEKLSPAIKSIADKAFSSASEAEQVLQVAPSPVESFAPAAISTETASAIETSAPITEGTEINDGDDQDDSSEQGFSAYAHSYYLIGGIGCGVVSLFGFTACIMRKRRNSRSKMILNDTSDSQSMSSSRDYEFPVQDVNSANLMHSSNNDTYYEDRSTKYFSTGLASNGDESFSEYATTTPTFYSDLQSTEYNRTTQLEYSEYSDYDEYSGTDRV
eukprot:NODE_26_length_35450_cov_0.398320.p13 type:complete len:236 gc:universal NODE_26_length_35450_cov_0.398320:14335-13628(-)